MRFACAAALPLAAFVAAGIARSPARAADTDGSAYTIFDPTPDDQLRPLETDRPTKSNSPHTVDAGHFQYEADTPVFSYSRIGATTARQWTFDPTIKAGLDDWMDLELTVTPYTHLRTSDGTAHGTRITSGVGDTVGRLKMNLFGNDDGDAAFALIPYVKFPTAEENLGNGAYEGGLIAPLSLTLPSDFTLIVMTELDALKDLDDDGRHANFVNLVNLSHPVGDKATVYTELFSSAAESEGGKPIFTGDLAVSYALTPALQLDSGANLGLSSTSPRVQIYLGVSERF